jgi:nitrite reductase (NADH) small subunit/3-phenylpropionate/trans-cinnamate dioxygenase ferredoxin subunit
MSREAAEQKRQFLPASSESRLFAHLSMTRIKIGKLADIPEGKGLEKRILARRVAVFRDGGELYGVESDCKHMRASLVTGGVHNGVLTCKWHGWRYDLKTDNCLTVKGVKLKRYAVEIEGDDVYVILG